MVEVVEDCEEEDDKNFMAVIGLLGNAAIFVQLLGNPDVFRARM